MFKLIKKLFQRKLDRLVQEKQGLEIKKQRIKDKTKTKNSVLETKIDKLTAKTWDNKQVENKLVKEIDRKLDKIARDIDSEKIYANQVADEETKEVKKEVKRQRIFLAEPAIDVNQHLNGVRLTDIVNTMNAVAVSGVAASSYMSDALSSSRTRLSDRTEDIDPTDVFGFVDTGM